MGVSPSLVKAPNSKFVHRGFKSHHTHQLTKPTNRGKLNKDRINMKEVSREFINSVPSMGGMTEATCICGKTHFAPDGECVYVATLNGCNYVVECDCGRLASIEELFWRLRRPLLIYYKERTERERRELSRELDFETLCNTIL